MNPQGIGGAGRKKVDRLASGSRFRLQNFAAGDRWRLAYDSVFKICSWRLACEAAIASDSPAKGVSSETGAVESL